MKQLDSYMPNEWITVKSFSDSHPARQYVVFYVIFFEKVENWNIFTNEQIEQYILTSRVLQAEDATYFQVKVKPTVNIETFKLLYGV